jgi:hypothetical protein
MLIKLRLPYKKYGSLRQFGLLDTAAGCSKQFPPGEVVASRDHVYDLRAEAPQRARPNYAARKNRSEGQFVETGKGVQSVDGTGFECEQ